MGECYFIKKQENDDITTLATGGEVGGSVTCFGLGGGCNADRLGLRHTPPRGCSGLYAGGGFWPEKDRKGLCSYLWFPSFVFHASALAAPGIGMSSPPFSPFSGPCF